MHIASLVSPVINNGLIHGQTALLVAPQTPTLNPTVVLGADIVQTSAGVYH